MKSNQFSIERNFFVNVLLQMTCLFIYSLSFNGFFVNKTEVATRRKIQTHFLYFGKKEFVLIGFR